MVDEILLFHKEMDNNSTMMSVEDALKMIPLVGYIPVSRIISSFYPLLSILMHLNTLI